MNQGDFYIQWISTNCLQCSFWHLSSLLFGQWEPFNIKASVSFWLKPLVFKSFLAFWCNRMSQAYLLYFLPKTGCSHSSTTLNQWRLLTFHWSRYKKIYNLRFHGQKLKVVSSFWKTNPASNWVTLRNYLIPLWLSFL